MTWLEECKAANQSKWQKLFAEALEKTLKEEKEEPAMQVSYNGFTGELVKLERRMCPPLNGTHIYDISIYDDENRCTHSFAGVKLEDVKFLGGAVSFGG